MELPWGFTTLHLCSQRSVILNPYHIPRWDLLVMIKWLLCQKFCWRRRENLHQRGLGGARKQMKEQESWQLTERENKERERIRDQGKDKTSDDEVEL